MTKLIQYLVKPMLLRVSATISAYLIGVGFPADAVQNWIAASVIILSIAVDLSGEVKKGLK